LHRLRQQIGTTFDFAAAEAFADFFAQRHFQKSQFLAETKTDIEVTRIDALDLEVQHRAAQVAAGGGIAGHAVDHGGALSKSDDNDTRSPVG
jgi:hypothetical protein